MTRVISSEANCIDISLPRSWGELTDKELVMVFKIMATVCREHLPSYVFKAMTGIKPKSCRNGWLRLSVRIPGKMRRVKVFLSTDEMAGLLAPLSFLLDPGNEPVRPERLKGRAPVNAQLHGLPFSEYIKLENAYQAYIATSKAPYLLAVANILYPSKRRIKSLCQWQQVALLNWLVQVKGMFAKRFPNLMRPASGNIGKSSVLDVMNNEIRALTGGDVSKEQKVFDTDCWRALTELDFKAKEAREFEQKMKK